MASPDDLPAPSPEYEDFADAQKSAARKAYPEWLKTQPVEVLALLNATGCGKVLDDREHVGPLDEGRDEEERIHDLQDSRRLQVVRDVASEIDTLGDELAEEFDIDPADARKIAGIMEERINLEVERRKAEQLHTIASFMIAPGNVRLRAFGLLYAANLGGLNGMGSQEDAAKHTLYSRASINDAVIEWRDLLELPTNGHMKSEVARQHYSEDKSSENHWRTKRFKGFPVKPGTSRKSNAVYPRINTSSRA